MAKQMLWLNRNYPNCQSIMIFWFLKYNVNLQRIKFNMIPFSGILKQSFLVWKKSRIIEKFIEIDILPLIAKENGFFIMWIKF